jgi:prevent-host-death family protein
MTMKTVNTHEAKTHLSRLLRRVAFGEEITIANRGVPVARLVPVPPAKAQRKLGDLRGQVWMSDDFDGPLPEEILAAFEGRTPAPRKRSRKPARAKI